MNREPALLDTDTLSELSRRGCRYLVRGDSADQIADLVLDIKA